MPTARIYQRAKNAMQAGRARAEEWRLEYEPSEPRRADPLTGWDGSGATHREMRLTLPSLQAPSASAQQKGHTAPLTPASQRVTTIQSYAAHSRQTAVHGPATTLLDSHHLQ